MYKFLASGKALVAGDGVVSQGNISLKKLKRLIWNPHFELCSNHKILIMLIISRL